MLSFFDKTRKILDTKFVFNDEVARITSLAFMGRKNAIIFGPGGHAKSEMVQEIINGHGLEDETFYQFFGEGMDESRLFGGLDFQKLEEEKVLEYFPERSFLNKRVAVFEELFDAPATVLLALKDVLTSKELRNGAQRFKMKTEVIICLTNREPAEISELGPAAHALIERFPLQLNLKWENYSSASYLKMFDVVENRMSGPDMNGFKPVLAEILANATGNGNFVSPRTAVHAFELCLTAAKMRGSTKVEKQDLTDLRFLPGLEGLAQTIQKDLEDALKRAQAERKLREAEAKFNTLLDEYREAAGSPIKLLQVSKRFTAYQDEISSLTVTDNLSDRRKKLRDSASQKAVAAQSAAMDATRI